MFEIVDSDIEKLSDKNLRELVVRLVEAELYQAGLPLSSVVAGGHQDAADGGIDVRVSIASLARELDFVPRGQTGFQVKVPDMPPSAIDAEMRPSGVLRESIKELMASGGAYVIVSAGGSVTDSAYKRRVKAMRDAAGDSSSSDRLHVDFYDRQRLARWVNQFPGVIFWMREQVGKQLSGWRPYGAWAHGDTSDSKYIADQTARLVDCTKRDQIHLSVQDGIEEIRALLAKPGGVVRLVGLSGVGKTKFVHALFDKRVGNRALDSSIVVYADEGHEPAPTAREMVRQLGAFGRVAILIVDNCRPDTHRALTELARQFAPQVSLMSIEYDMLEDDPEGTSVFRLEPDSNANIEEILIQLAPHLNHASRSRIADLSGGNARVALALARQIQRGDNISHLTDADLFKRLFEQRNAAGEKLLRAAEVCALVYSFDGENMESSQSELAVLANIAELSVNQVHGFVQELHRRDLVQRRSRWRAILPHAVANRLARRALESIPTESLSAAFSCSGRERLLQSFSRRLSYLHNCEPAIRIARQWLLGEHALRDVESLNELGQAVLQNVAPLAPETTLEVIEQRLSSLGVQKFLEMGVQSRHTLMRLLRMIAFEAKYFDRAALVLAQLHWVETRGGSNNTMRDCFPELFQIQLSGTQAVQSQRMRFLLSLIQSDDSGNQEVGLAALGAMIKARHISSYHDFSVGAHAGNYGWMPASAEEVANWFRCAVAEIARLISVCPGLRDRLTSMLASKIRELWGLVGIDDELEVMALGLGGAGQWPEGWLAVRSLLSFDGNSMGEDGRARVARLEEKLRPNNLLARIQAFVLIRPIGHLLDIADIEALEDETGVADAYQRADKLAVNLGKAAINDLDVLKAVLPELLSDGSGRRWQFGTGLALRATEPVALWNELADERSKLPESQQGIQLLRGFISGLNERSPELANRVLDNALVDPRLAQWFPALECAIEVTEAGAKRLLESLAQEHAPIERYGQMMYAGVANKIPATLFEQLVFEIAQRPNGLRVAVDIVNMRLHSMKSAGQPVDSATTLLGRRLLALCDFGDNNSNHAYHVHTIAKCCLGGEEATETAMIVCVRLAKEISGRGFGVGEYGKLVETLFRLHPYVALHVFLGGGRRRKWEPFRYRMYVDSNSPLQVVPDELLFRWAKRNPYVRFPRLAAEIQIIRRAADGKIEWAPFALQILECSPDRQSVLDAYSDKMHPRSWAGSLADALEPYKQLVSLLSGHTDAIVRKWAKSAEEYLIKRIQSERSREKISDERFE